MKRYLVHDKGKIREVAYAGYGFDFTKKEIELNNKDYKVVEIDKSTFEKVKINPSNFIVINDKFVVKRKKAEINKIKARQKKWKSDNTIEGLKKRVLELERKK